MKKMIFLKVKNSYNKKLVTWLDLNLQVAHWIKYTNSSKQIKLLFVLIDIIKDHHPMRAHIPKQWKAQITKKDAKKLFFRFTKQGIFQVGSLTKRHCMRPLKILLVSWWAIIIQAKALMAEALFTWFEATSMDQWGTSWFLLRAKKRQKPFLKSIVVQKYSLLKR